MTNTQETRKSSREKKPIERYESAPSAAFNRTSKKKKNKKSTKQVAAPNPAPKQGKTQKATKKASKRRLATPHYSRQFPDKKSDKTARKNRFEKITKALEGPAYVPKTRRRRVLQRAFARLREKRSVTLALINRAGLPARHSALPSGMEALLKANRDRLRYRRRWNRYSVLRQSAARDFRGPTSRQLQQRLYFHLSDDALKNERDSAMPDDRSFRKKIAIALGIERKTHFRAVAACEIGSELKWLWTESFEGKELDEWLKEPKNFHTILKCLFLAADEKKLHDLQKTDLGAVFFRNLIGRAYLNFGDGSVHPDWFCEAAKIILVAFIPDEYKIEMENWRSIVAFLLMNVTNCSVPDDQEKQTGRKLIETYTETFGPDNKMIQLAHIYHKFSRDPENNAELDVRKKYSELFAVLKNEQTNDEMYAAFAEMSKGLSPVAKDVMRGMLLLALARNQGYQVNSEEAN